MKEEEKINVCSVPVNNLVLSLILQATEAQFVSFRER